MNFVALFDEWRQEAILFAQFYMLLLIMKLSNFYDAIILLNNFVEAGATDQPALKGCINRIDNTNDLEMP